MPQYTKSQLLKMSELGIECDHSFTDDHYGDPDYQKCEKCDQYKPLDKEDE